MYNVNSEIHGCHWRRHADAFLWNVETFHLSPFALDLFEALVGWFLCFFSFLPPLDRFCASSFSLKIPRCMVLPMPLEIDLVAGLVKLGEFVSNDVFITSEWHYHHYM